MSYPQTTGTIAEFRHFFALPSGRHSNLGFSNNSELYRYLYGAVIDNILGIDSGRCMGYVNQEVQSLYSSYLRDVFLTSNLDLKPHNTLGGHRKQKKFFKII